MHRETLGQKLKKARTEKGLTQKDVEEIIKIPQANLSNYERGRNEPDIETLGLLIDLYEVSADWILSTGKKKRTD